MIGRPKGSIPLSAEHSNRTTQPFSCRPILLFVIAIPSLPARTASVLYVLLLSHAPVDTNILLTVYRFIRLLGAWWLPER